MKNFIGIHLFELILLLAIVILCAVEKNNRIKIKEQNNLLESLNTDLIKWKTKDSLNHAKIQVIKTQRINDFLELENKDSLILELKKEVKKHKKNITTGGNSITIFETNTNIKNSSKTKIVSDTLKNYPKYKSNINIDDWVIGNVFANKDSTKINLKIKNAYSVVIGSEKQGLFKKTKPYVEVINKNPFSETKSLRTYQVSLPKQKRFSLGISVNYGIGKGFEFQPFIGIGIQYNLIRF